MNINVALSPAVNVRVIRRQGNEMESRAWQMILATPLMQLMVVWVRAKRIFWQVLYTNHLLFDGFGGFCRSIKEGAASWKALDIIYNYSGEGSPVDRLWIGHMRNAQAVRNRKRIIVKCLREQATSVAVKKGSVRILSLASGSAQAVFEALSGFPHPVEVLLIDFDRAVGPYVQRLAEKCGLSHVVRFKAGNVLKFDRSVMLGGFEPDMIEMAGLLDYLEDGQAVSLIGRIYGLLAPGGIFTTCHIHDNPERDFMTHVIGWGRDDGKQRPMLYRSQDTLIDLVRAGGFKIMTAYVEPHHIHSVVVAHKS